VIFLEEENVCLFVCVFVCSSNCHLGLVHFNGLTNRRAYTDPKVKFWTSWSTLLHSQMMKCECWLTLNETYSSLASVILTVWCYGCGPLARQADYGINIILLLCFVSGDRSAFKITFLGAFAKLRRATISFVMSVRPHGTTRLPLDGVSWNLIFEYFSKICRDKSILVKIWQE
jgi:hypothetical protein